MSVRRLLVSTIFLIACAASAAEVLDNAAIVRLTGAGLPPDVILLKIDQSEARFDTSTDALIALKKGGVADAVIKAMMLKSPAVPAPAIAIAPKPPSQTCARLETNTLGNWVPAGVCVSATDLSLDEQSFAFADLKVQCIELPRLPLGSGTATTWRWSNGTESFAVRGNADDIRHLSDALTAAAPAVRHGNCGDAQLRGLLKTTDRR
jgi:hypothetical protein